MLSSNEGEIQMQCSECEGRGWKFVEREQIVSRAGLPVKIVEMDMMQCPECKGEGEVKDLVRK